jgi:hypothetical protein
MAQPGACMNLEKCENQRTDPTFRDFSTPQFQQTHKRAM